MRVLLLLAIGCTAALAAPPASERMSQRIVGGSETTIEEYPYMSNMQFFLNYAVWHQWCGGAVISPRTILSAAHCYRRTLVGQWRVRLGSAFTHSGGALYSVLQIISHPSFNENNSNNDIAIVRLVNEVTLGGSVQSIQIPGPNYVLPAGTPVSFVGWGLTSANGVGSSVLRHVDVTVLDQQACAALYAPLVGIPNVNDNMVCAGFFDSKGADACQGDSGGPVVHKTSKGDFCIGLVSWAISCDSPIYPGVNTRVSKYHDWIMANGF